ncbi:hypothetical protein, partial [Streptomyces sp. NPDC058086]|uniref:hypothetical protein n=1 Tax=Streptomyces sp. NPDC058086 TaxID=3346334 RepID=UPI0036EEC92A
KAQRTPALRASGPRIAFPPGLKTGIPCEEQGVVRLRICSSFWTASLGSVGGRVMNGVNDFVQTPRHTD